MAAALPDFIPPMLARLEKRPFDSDRHEFEIKWDGTRALAFVEGGAHRLRNRRDRDVAPTYPELDFLGRLPGGLVLDGEIVVLRDGVPDFRGMLRREQVRGERDARRQAQLLPATYVVFDLLYEGGRPLLEAPLVERRGALARLVERCAEARLVFSDGIVGAGLRCFEEVSARALEGVVAKRLDSPYLPGRRTDAWVKIKAFKRILCAILGYVADADGDLRSLVIASDDDGQLACVGKVGSGLSEAQRRELKSLCDARPRAAPLVACEFEGRWVEPGLYCTVSFLERTPGGMLRAPVFQELLPNRDRYTK